MNGSLRHAGGVQCIIENTTVADLIVLGKCGSNFTGPTSRYSYYHNTLMPEAFHIPCVDAHFSMDVNFTLKSQEYVYELETLTDHESDHRSHLSCLFLEPASPLLKDLELTQYYL